MMEERRQKVISDLDQAESDRKKAKVACCQREAALKDSKQEATQILFLLQKSNAEKLRIILLVKLIKKLPQLGKRASEDAAQAKTDALSMRQKRSSS